MKKAEDFRSIARDTLTGKWKNAVLVGLVASLLGAVDGAGLDLNIDIDAGNAKASLELAGQTVFTTGGSLNSDIGAFLVGGAIYLLFCLCSREQITGIFAKNCLFITSFHLFYL